MQMLDMDAARNEFRRITAECAEVIPIIRKCNTSDEGEIKKLFSEHLAPIIVRIEDLDNKYLVYYDLDIDTCEIGVGKLQAYMLFFVLAVGIYIGEIFKDASEVAKMFGESEVFEFLEPCDSDIEERGNYVGADGTYGIYEIGLYTVEEFARALQAVDKKTRH